MDDEAKPGASKVFRFEEDFAGDLRCIPMAVRFGLDLVGIKLSLRQWSRLSAGDRSALLALPVTDEPALVNYRSEVTACLLRQGDQPVSMEMELSPEWATTQQVPDQVSTFATLAGVPAPTLPQWQALSELQRFTLVKLSRAKHDNVNFVPALREFGLLA
jgi:hypothetical protein